MFSSGGGSAPTSKKTTLILVTAVPPPLNEKPLWVVAAPGVVDSRVAPGPWSVMKPGLKSTIEYWLQVPQVGSMPSTGWKKNRGDL